MNGAPGIGGETVQRVHTCESLSLKYLHELENHGRSRLTVRQYKYVISYWEKWLAGYGIHFLGVTRQDIEQYLSDMRGQGLSPVTIRDRAIIVRNWYAWLVALDYMPKNPFTLVQPVKVPAKLQSVMNVGEVDRMARACRGVRELAIVETLYSTGMRRAGLAGIKLQDLDLEAGTVKIAAKGGKDMFCLLSPRAVKAITRWLKVRLKYPSLKRRPSDYLFIGRSVTRPHLDPSTVGMLIKRIARNAGLNKRITTHSYRRSFATHLADNDVRIEDIQQMMGHENIQTTQKYIRYSTARLAVAHSRLPRR